MEFVAEYNEMLVAELAKLHPLSFPAHMLHSDPVEYFTEGLRDEGAINFVLQSPANRIVGHLLAYPQSSVYEELRRWDPAMEDDPEGLYLEIIQVLPEQRRTGNATRLFERMALEAPERGFTRLSMHARKRNGMDEMIRKLFPENRFVRTVENWLDTGESFEYIETTTRFDTSLNRRPAK